MLRPTATIVSAALVAAWLSAPSALAQSAVPVAGTVRDITGAVVADADVSLLTSGQSIVGTVKTDPQGRFSFPRVQQGRYLLLVIFPGFNERRVAVNAGPRGARDVDVTLRPEGVRAEVTVTASPGVVQEATLTAQPVNVIDSREIFERAKAVVAQIANEETGVQLLRTAPVMAGVYVRGLTGNKVNVFVDGVRYSTSAARGGVNTFLNLIEPTSLEGVEVLRGPNSAQYGSDALGGSVQFLSQVPAFSATGRPTVRGALTLRGNTADQSAGSNLSGGYAGGRVGVYVNLAGRRVNEIRTGQGIDTHAAATRFLGLVSDVVMPERLPDTAFTQYGGQVKLNWAPTANDQFIVSYTRNQQDGGKRYDQLLGGDGNLVADLRNLMLDLAHVKYNRQGLGWFDQFSATWSFNAQREERVNQGGNGNPRNSITHEYERTLAQGFQAHLTKRLGDSQDLVVGGEFYPERITSPSFSMNPVTHVASIRRGRVPDQARYRSGGVYAQDVVDLVPGKLKLVGNARYSFASYESKASDSPVVGGKALWPDDSLSVSSATFRAGVVASPKPELTFTANVSRGFRAPHMTDLGTLGLTGSGFQVAGTSVEGMGATIGSSAAATAVSTGRPVEQVSPESNLTWEAGVRYNGGRVTGSFSWFVNDISDNIAYQSLILPQGAVGRLLGDQVITAQGATGVVYVAAATNPVLVRANFDNARIWGLEHSLDWKISGTLSLSTVATYMRAADKETGLAPNIEGGTPAPDAYVKLRYVHPGGRFWIVPYVHLAAKQDRLSTLDLEDRRTGAPRTRSNIRNFFLNGATARGWVVAGPDGVMGTSDDRLAATGETLSQVQDRVLGAGVASGQLWTEVPGYVTVSMRCGLRIGRQQELVLDVENIGDRSYRGIAWGVDGPGRGVSVAYQARF